MPCIFANRKPHLLFAPAGRFGSSAAESTSLRSACLLHRSADNLLDSNEPRQIVHQAMLAAPHAWWARRITDSQRFPEPKRRDERTPIGEQPINP
ncbi:hypothetical protein WS62_23605 [Burkholderia sp. ABCPW 14]|nr:hypothetical protein WS62_23605 [Burkholderia sp. ABCPW 14]